MHKYKLRYVSITIEKTAFFDEKRETTGRSAVSSEPDAIVDLAACVASHAQRPWQRHRRPETAQPPTRGVRRLCHLGKATNSVSEIPANAALFPVAIAHGIRPATPADFGRTRLCRRIAQPAAFFGLGQGTLRRWRQNAGRRGGISGNHIGRHSDRRRGICCRLVPVDAGLW
jgi:hypothetical protein